jgi:hypothetical protein
MPAVNLAPAFCVSTGAEKMSGEVIDRLDIWEALVDAGASAQEKADFFAVNGGNENDWNELLAVRDEEKGAGG